MQSTKKIKGTHIALTIIGLAIIIGIASIIRHTNSGKSLTALVPGTDMPSPSSDQSYKLHEGLGYNAPWMYGVTHGPAGTQAELTQAVKYLNNPIIRFPGGTVSRTYHFNLPGYDGKQGNETQNYIIPFTNIFAPNNQPLARISFVVNLDDHFRHITYKGTDEEMINDNLKALTYLLDHGFKVPLVELGNEQTTTPQFFWSFGTKPWKPIDTIVENVQALVEIKATYKINDSYQRAHFKEGMDKYVSLLATYRDRINALMDSRGLPHPKYGVSIPPIASFTYSDVRTWNRYYSERIRDDAQWIDALIPHFYAAVTPGNPSVPSVNLQKTIDGIKSFYGNRHLWITEFSAGGGATDDSADQIATFDKLVETFEKSENNVDYYFMHQYFVDAVDFGMIYKKLTTNSKPVNGIIANGKYTVNPASPLKLFYSPRFCWSVKMRGASIGTYQEVKDKYGCK